MPTTLKVLPINVKENDWGLPNLNNENKEFNVMQFCFELLFELLKEQLNYAKLLKISLNAKSLKWRRIFYLAMRCSSSSASLNLLFEINHLQYTLS